MKQFLESEIPKLPKEACFFHVIPAPLEVSVTYGTGTAKGPHAILEASDQLEAFDGIRCPCERGIYTTHDAQTLDDIETAVSAAFNDEKFPVLLGGEHTVTLGALRALKASGVIFGVVQFDAHADLRDEYEGSSLNHACVMRRVIDELDLPLFQIGVRALSFEEHQLREVRKIPHLDAAEIAGEGLPETLLPSDFPEKVYVTFDVDGLDPSAMPSTGTPVPNGLSWREAFQCLDLIAAERRIIAADVVELAPKQGFPASDFGAAQLVYKMMGLALKSV